jgi:hypothetical protein
MAAASAPKRQITAGSGGTTDAWYARGAGVGVPLSLVVSDLCLRPGLTAGEIDVGELTDTVRGNAISRQSSALVDFRQAFTQALESTKNHDRHRSHFPPAPLRCGGLSCRRLAKSGRTKPTLLASPALPFGSYFRVESSGSLQCPSEHV